MCGSVTQAQPKPVAAPACPPPAAAPPPAHCAPVVDSYTPPPAAVVSPEKPVSASATTTSASTTAAACAPKDAAAKDGAACAQPEKGDVARMLRAVFTAVFAFVAMFMQKSPAAERAPANADRDGPRCDWRSFEGRREQKLVAPTQQDAAQRTFNPATSCSHLRA